MKDDTLAALKESIAHWERLRDDKRLKGETPGSHHCELCGLFFAIPGSARICQEGCPVFDATKRDQCVGSPYYRAALAWRYWKDGDWSKEQAEPLIQAEIDFLKSLHNVIFVFIGRNVGCA